MADSIVKLTRELISEFAKDRRTIKFFEQLQGVVVDSLPISLASLFLRVDQTASLADDSLSISQQALAAANKQDLLIDIPVSLFNSELPLQEIPVYPVAELPLFDVKSIYKFDDVLPDILQRNTDTRKFDAITSSYGSRWIGPSSGLTVNTTEVDLTAAFGAGTQLDIGLSPFTYDSGTNAFFVSKEYTDAFFFDIILRLSGTSPSPASQSQPIVFFLRRSDGSLITTMDYVVGRGLSGTLTNETVQLPTFVFAGGSDPYQTLGFRISAAGGNAGWSITDKTLFLKR